MSHEYLALVSSDLPIHVLGILIIDDARCRIATALHLFSLAYSLNTWIPHSIQQIKELIESQYQLQCCYSVVNFMFTVPYANYRCQYKFCHMTVYLTIKHSSLQ